MSDKEDGTIGKGINAEDVSVSINYIEGFDKTIIEQGHKSNESFIAGKRLIDLNDCAACHAKDKKSIGPAYVEIAKKYPKNSANISQLANNIINGGGGVWGEQAMAAHPQLNQNDAKDIVDFILSINDAKRISKPLAGKYETLEHIGKQSGAYVIQASYTDKGATGVGPITVSEVLALQSPTIACNGFDKSEKTMEFKVPSIGKIVLVNDSSSITFNKIDLTDITNIAIMATGQSGQTSGGKIELWMDDKLKKEAEVPADNKVPVVFEIEEKYLKPAKVEFRFRNPNAGGKPLFAVLNYEFK